MTRWNHHRTCWRCNGAGNWMIERRWPVWAICQTCMETGTVPIVMVDALVDFGWVLNGHRVKNCHMFVPNPLWTWELHRIADAIGMKRRWFQWDKKLPHYDLTKSKRAAAIREGAIEVDRVTTVEAMHVHRQFRIRRQRR